MKNGKYIPYRERKKVSACRRDKESEREEERGRGRRGVTSPTILREESSAM